MMSGEDAIAVAHIAAFATFVGTVVAFDLRLLGLTKSIPVRVLARHLLPWSAAAWLVILPTGIALFTAHADELINHRPFQLKMALLLAAGMNAAAFHTGPFRTVAAWDSGMPAPWGARISAMVSLALWLAVIACGRLVAHR
jgi:hypothetical protein